MGPDAVCGSVASKWRPGPWPGDLARVVFPDDPMDLRQSAAKAAWTQRAVIDVPGANARHARVSETVVKTTVRARFCRCSVVVAYRCIPLRY